MRSAIASVLVIGAFLAAPTSAQDAKPPRDKERRAFTDADLAAYAEKRRREGRDAAAAASSSTDPTPKAASPQPSASPEPATAAGTLRVVIDDVFGTLSAADKARAEQLSERIAGFYESPPAELRIRLRYFVKEDEFQEALRKAYGREVRFGGFYAWGKEIVVGPHRENFKTLVHEMSHFIADKTFDRKVPGWLDEGLAEFFSHAAMDPAGLKVTLPPNRLKLLAQWKAAGRQPDLRTLFQMSREEVFAYDLKGDPQIRALSWSIVDFLTSNEDNTKLLHRFVRELHTQNAKRDPYDAIVMSYAGGIQALEAAWLAHVDKRLGS